MLKKGPRCKSELLHGGDQATKAEAEAKEMARAGTLSTTTDFIILAKFISTIIIFFVIIKNIIIIDIVDLHAIIILKALTTMILLPSKQEV